MNLHDGLGATPEGAKDEASAAAQVRAMFEEIAPRYDLLNHVLSAGVDGYWWRRAAETFDAVLKRPESVVVDLCCGTGDMTAALLRRRPAGARVITGVDFSSAMLALAREKLKGANAVFVEGDALRLGLESGSVDLVTSAFGFRNLANYDAGLREIARVLKVGGEVGILDCNEPEGLLGRAYRVYFKHVLPVVGSWISGTRGPYAYLPRSVERFPRAARMLEMMRAAGFVDVSWTAYTFGVAGLYRGRKG